MIFFKKKNTNPLKVVFLEDFERISDFQKWKLWSGYAFENICLASP